MFSTPARVGRDDIMNTKKITYFPYVKLKNATHGFFIDARTGSFVRSTIESAWENAAEYVHGDACEMRASYWHADHNDKVDRLLFVQVIEEVSVGNMVDIKCVYAQAKQSKINELRSQINALEEQVASLERQPEAE